MVEQVFSKLKELGRANSKREELQEYCIQQLDQVEIVLFWYLSNTIQLNK